ncbi:sulfotransferase [Pseudomonadales bacterium]|jgi:tetratricopeptide (TPR) repeat protein|nr:sulfotransferase [Pseudomonadales bacterium]MDB4806518.1 sulfotransferase [Pseudomonadales bacterium]
MTKNNISPPKIEMLPMPKVIGSSRDLISNKELVEYALAEEKKTNFLITERLLLQGSAKEKQTVCAANLMRFYTRQHWNREAWLFFHSLPKNKKTNVSIRLQLGINLINYGKMDEAIESLNYCRIKRPSSAPLLCHLARCYGAQGDISKARKLFEAAVQLDPYYIVALREMTHLCKDEDVSKYTNLLYLKIQQPNLPDKQKVTCLFALAKAFHRINDTESELEFLKKANKLARKTQAGQDFRALRVLHRHTVRSISKRTISESELKDLEKDIVLIVCLPRSGASLLEGKISEAFGLKQTGESDLYNSAMVEFNRQGNSLSLKAIDVAGTQRLQLDYTELLSCPKRGDFIQSYNRILSDIATGSAGLINKSLGNAWQAPVLMKMMKNIKVINLTRDPRDLAISALQANFETGHGYIYSAADLESQIEHHEAMTAIWLDQFPERVLPLRYEDFVSNTEFCLDKLGSFLNIDRKNVVEQKAVTITSSIWQVQNKIHQASVSKWKKYEPLLEGRFGTNSQSKEL